MKNKKIMLRKCIGCNDSKDKLQLIKIVKNKNGNIEVDETGKKEGRGAYICNDAKCLEIAIKKKSLNKVFKMQIDEKIYEDLKNIIIKK